MNGEYMKAMDDEKFYEMALPYIQKTVHRPLDFKKIAAMVKTRIEVFPDIADLIDFFEEVPEYDASMYTHKKDEDKRGDLPCTSSGSKTAAGSAGRFQQ